MKLSTAVKKLLLGVVADPEPLKTPEHFRHVARLQYDEIKLYNFGKDILIKFYYAGVPVSELTATNLNFKNEDTLTLNNLNGSVSLWGDNK